MTQIIIVGAGLGGLTAAARAVELGCTPIVLEQGADPRYPCNSRASGGIFHIAHRDIKDDKEQLLEAIRSSSNGEAHEALARTLCDNASRSMDWLLGHGITFVKSGPLPYHRWTAAPPRPMKPGIDFPGYGVDRILATLARLVERSGGRLMLGHRAIGMGRRDDGTLQVDCLSSSGEAVALTAPAVIIADGGFQANPDLLRKYITTRPDLLVQRGAATSRGHGLMMAESLGAAVTRADRFYGHPLHRAALDNPRLSPYPQLDSVIAASLVVGADGCRFADEGRGGVWMANAIAALGDPASSHVIFDERIWDSAGRKSLAPVNPALEQLGGHVFRAQSIADLARQIGIDESKLCATVAQYNASLASGEGGRLSPPRSGTVPLIEGPTYMAVPLCAGITHTMGGLAVDEHMRVVDRDARPIPGLYAVGGSTGGLEGGQALNYVGGLAKAIVMGLCAAEHVAGPVPAPRPVALPESPARGKHARRSYPYLRGAVRYGGIASIILALLGGALLSWALASAGLWVAGIAFVLGGAGTFLAARVLSDLLALIHDVLLPGDD